MSEGAAWTGDEWLAISRREAVRHLRAAGCSLTGAVRTVKRWGRSCIQTAPTATGVVWIKYGYGLPPGEETVLAELAPRHAGQVPEVIVTWPGAVALAPLPGTPLTVESPLPHWCAAARTLATLQAAERVHSERWLTLGVRDRRPAAFAAALQGLLEGPAVEELDTESRRRLERRIPRLGEAFAAAFTQPPTLIHQDAGCDNVHIHGTEALLFDWADVVIGHPVFAADRLLAHASVNRREAVIDAFREPLGLDRAEFDALRRFAPLHELLRYQDELPYLQASDPLHAGLLQSIRSGLLEFLWQSDSDL
jgi:hypothetical protein